MPDAKTSPKGMGKFMLSKHHEEYETITQICNMVDEYIKEMEYPLVKLTLPREFVQRISHEGFGTSKVIWLDAVEDYLNKKYNSRGLYAMWQMCEGSYLITVLPRELLTEQGKQYFGITD